MMVAMGFLTGLNAFVLGFLYFKTRTLFWAYLVAHDPGFGPPFTCSHRLPLLKVRFSSFSGVLPAISAMIAFLCFSGEV